MTISDEKVLLLGVDGGGTRCRAQLCDMSGKILGTGETGSANTTHGRDNAFSEVLKAAEIAVSDAGLDHSCHHRIYAGLGLAGLSLRREHQAINAYPHPFAGLHAETDAHIACLGAHAGGDGAILIAGTGTCGLLIKDGVPHTAGGWGFALADQGSGALLGRRALRRALQEHEAILPSSGMGRSLMAHFKNDPENMIVWSETAKLRDYGAFAPEIFNLANDRDEAAMSLVQGIADDCEQLIRALVSKGADGVVMFGGLADPIMSWLSEEVKSHLKEPKGNALDGAIHLARQTYERSAAND